MEIFKEDLEKLKESEEGKKNDKEGKKKSKRFKLSFPFSNPYIFIGLGTIVAVLLIFAFSGRKSIIKQQADIEIINKVIEEQLKTQREMNKVLIKEIQALREELKALKQSNIPSAGGRKETEKNRGKSLLDILRSKREEKKLERKKQDKLKELERKLKELERSRKEVPMQNIRMEFHEREAKVDVKKKLLAGKNRKKKEKKRTVFIPAGTVIKGRIVSGFFAPVGEGVKFPSVLIELKGVASAPNNFRIPLDKCRVIAKAEGDWVLERAKLQTYKLACVLPSGKVIEKRFNASVTSGLDGMDGVKGKFVNASAKQLRTFFGGTFLGTLFESLARAQVRTNIGVEGGAVFKSEVIENEAEYAFYRALADTWKQFSQFYLEQAKKALPVVLVEGNIPVYLEVIDGFSLEVSPDEMVADIR